MAFDIKNFSIDVFNRDINDSGNLDAKYKNWSDYRRKVTAFIEKGTGVSQDAKSVLVLGAGNLNDVDAAYLCGRYDNVTLSDADIESVRNGLIRQNISERDKKKITIIKSDYTGAEKAGFFSGLETMAKRMEPATAIAEYINNKADKMKPEKIEGTYDLVISCPVHTQLLYTQIEIFLKILYDYGTYELSDLNRILNAAYQKTPVIIKRYNDMMLALCKKEGKLLILTDIIEMEIKSALLKKVKKIMSAEAAGQEEIEKIIRKKGIERAAIGIEDFIEKTSVLETAYFMWPFNEIKEYLVYGVFANNKS